MGKFIAMASSSNVTPLSCMPRTWIQYSTCEELAPRLASRQFCDGLEAAAGRSSLPESLSMLQPAIITMRMPMEMRKTNGNGTPRPEPFADDVPWLQTDSLECP